MGFQFAIATCNLAKAGVHAAITGLSLLLRSCKGVYRLQLMLSNVTASAAARIKSMCDSMSSSMLYLVLRLLQQSLS